MENQKRSNAERITIALLIIFGVAVMIGIQSLFLTHVSSALPLDPIWRFVTILCFLAPPVMVGLLSVFKLNYSRSSAQDWILVAGMGIELFLFMVNVIVAVNGNAIDENMLGVIGIILGGTAGIVSVGTVAFTLAADPVRAVEKRKLENALDLVTAQVENELATMKAALEQNKQNILAAMSSDRVRERSERGAETFVMQTMGKFLGQQLTSNADAVQPNTIYLPSQTQLHETPADWKPQNTPTFPPAARKFEPSPTPKISPERSSYIHDDAAVEMFQTVMEEMAKLYMLALRAGIELTAPYKNIHDNGLGDAARLANMQNHLERLRAEYEAKHKTVQFADGRRNQNGDAPPKA